MCPTIEESDVTIHELIGIGGFAKVYRAEMRTSRAEMRTSHGAGVGVGGGAAEEGGSRRVALKALEHLPQGDKSIGVFVKEIELMSRLHHPNLLGLLGVCVSPESLAVVTEYMGRGSVYGWLRKHCHGRPPPRRLSLRILAQTAQGMLHLHSCSPRVVHRDLKSSNIILGHDYAVKVADFGLSREFLQTNAMSRVGTLQWVAP